MLMQGDTSTAFVLQCLELQAALMMQHSLDIPPNIPPCACTLCTAQYMCMHHMCMHHMCMHDTTAAVQQRLDT
jgi:hypothetical protein